MFCSYFGSTSVADTTVSYCYSFMCHWWVTRRMALLLLQDWSLGSQEVFRAQGVIFPTHGLGDPHTGHILCSLPYTWRQLKSTEILQPAGDYFQVVLKHWNSLFAHAKDNNVLLFVFHCCFEFHLFAYCKHWEPPIPAMTATCLVSSVSLLKYRDILLLRKCLSVWELESPFRTDQ